MVWAAAIAPEPIASFRPAYGSENRMIPEVRACSGYLVIIPQNGRIATTPEPWSRDSDCDGNPARTRRSMLSSAPSSKATGALGEESLYTLKAVLGRQTGDRRR